MMKLSAPSPAPSPDACRDGASTRADAAAAARGRPPHDPARGAFERALQARQARPDAPSGSPDDEGDRPIPEATCGAPGVEMPPVPLRPAVATPPPERAGAVDAAATGPRAAIEAALASNPGQAVLPLAGTDPAALWQVSIGEPLGAPLELRAQRAERAPHEAQAAWNVSIRSSALGADALGRHVGRLHERLRRHGIEVDHLRVDGGDDGEAEH